MTDPYATQTDGFRMESSSCPEPLGCPDVDRHLVGSVWTAPSGARYRLVEAWSSAGMPLREWAPMEGSANTPGAAPTDAEMFAFLAEHGEHFSAPSEWYGRWQVSYRQFSGGADDYKADSLREAVQKCMEAYARDKAYWMEYRQERRRNIAKARAFVTGAFDPPLTFREVRQCYRSAIRTGSIFLRNTVSNTGAGVRIGG